MFLARNSGPAHPGRDFLDGAQRPEKEQPQQQHQHRGEDGRPQDPGTGPENCGVDFLCFPVGAADPLTMSRRTVVLDPPGRDRVLMCVSP